MQLAVSTNIDQVFAQMDRFVEQAQAVAVPRALNRLQEQAQTAGLRTIARVYGVGPRTMERYLRARTASTRELEATLTMAGRSFPLYALGARKAKGGVAVTIKGRRVVVPHAFIARMKNGHVGVYARGSYGGKGLSKSNGKRFGRFVFSTPRFPINEFFTFGPATTFKSESVVDAMNDRVREQAGKVLAQEIRFATR